MTSHDDTGLRMFNVVDLILQAVQVSPMTRSVLRSCDGTYGGYIWVYMYVPGEIVDFS